MSVEKRLLPVVASVTQKAIDVSFRIGRFHGNLANCQCPPRMQVPNVRAPCGLFGNIERAATGPCRQTVGRVSAKNCANGVIVADNLGHIQPRATETPRKCQRFCLAKYLGNLR